MKMILKKTVNVTKGKYGKYGVARTENKILKEYIGKQVTIKVLE
ncbi:hypothetical protein LCGC14_2220720 [marine sediment metagenome]|uniref:Uncharacterized protein n=1 Tax=marine sediment metagenome TaxID=412755 RepID=A0A0F9DYM0_9ZZZZ